MYIKNHIKDNCYGCTACSSICAKRAIIMKKDKEGFKYPYIHRSKCNNCKVCIEICPIKINKEPRVKIVYGAKLKDITKRLKSQSGGISAILVDRIIKSKGVVYGAIQNKEIRVIHKRFSSKINLELLKGSKYVQSDMSGIFHKVNKDIREKKKILFIGTPCQVAGLKRYTERFNYSDIYFVDIVCHGVPSPKIFKDFLEYFKKLEKQEIENFTFRNKSFGWKSHVATIKFSNKEIHTELYRNIFASSNALRPSCYSCEFASMERVSDITIGDFWGIEKVDSSFLDEEGLSIVLVNTEKGELLFEEIKEDIEYRKYKLTEEAIQPNLRRPTPRPDNRDVFWENYYKKGFETIVNKYSDNKTD